ncbi:hypothetical protein [Microbacterium pygmaeum]|uniref:Uncharacterized protein n=1 Tax=Microbacterium pygmaeum TaxID=370764 RepID=A0A1G7UXK8_9MICO|nr:hypothetical protein [Microbacterium pygmaeum]SDG51859.1 hypothetical protein SAMN04489810_0515 [Microbacterium pygmaeum]
MTQATQRSIGDDRETLKALPFWVPAVIGAAGAVIGMLPWWITGARLPLQNVWVDTPPAAMPIALLPFSQYAISLVVGLLVTGAAAAGLTLRLLRARLPRRPILLALGGVLFVQVVAIGQTAAVASTGLREDWRADLYYAALLSGIVVTTLLGAAVLALLAATPPAGAIIGAAGGALAFSFWLAGLSAALGSAGSPLLPLLEVVRWAPAVLIGFAIGWWGIASAGRAVAAVGALALLWLVPGVTTGLGNAVGSRVLANDLPSMLSYGLEVTRMALTMPELVLPPLVVAIVVAVVVGAARWAMRRARPAEQH